jgi:hypothetical protein
MDRTENTVSVAAQLLLSDDTTYSIVACAAIGTNCAENTIPILLFNVRCLVTADWCDSTIFVLSEYATILFNSWRQERQWLLRTPF